MKATAIIISEDLLHYSTIIADKIFIASNYEFLEESIEKLVSCGQPLHANIKIVTYIMNIITNMNTRQQILKKENLSTAIYKKNALKHFKIFSHV